MFTLRDTLAATLLGVQLPSNDSSNNSVSDAKKPKKKAHKKKPKKKKAGAQPRDEEDDNEDYESISSEAGNEQDDDDVIASFGATGQSVTAASAMASKKAAIMAQQYESTQIEDQIHQMIRKLAEEFNLDKLVVSETVNRMFESGLQYDNREAVLKHLPIKGNATRSIDVKDESGLQFTSAASSPYPVSPLPHNTANTRPAARTARAFSGSAPEAGAIGTGSSVDTDAAAALAKLTTPSACKPAAVQHAQADSTIHSGAGKAKHGKEIGAVPTSTTQLAPIGPKSSVQVTHAEPALNSMKEKLDYVASYAKTNLYDSLAALCSWASVSVAPDSTISAEQEKQQKMDAFFQSQALEILLTTLFSDESQQLSTRPDVKGAFHALLQHVLLSHGDSGGAGNMQHITDTLAQVVSQVCSLRTAQVVPAFSSHSVRGNQILAQQIAACVKRLYSQLTFPVSAAASDTHNAGTADATDGNDDLFGKLEAIDAQLHALEKSTAKKGTSATEVAHEKVQNMFLTREIHSDKLQLCLESLKKASTHKPASSASRSVTSKAQMPTANATELTRSVAESTASIERILLNECDLLGSGLAHPHSPVATVSSVQSKHQQSHHINSQYDRLSYERDAKLGALSNELSASNMRMQELSAHKQRLLEQVQLCDQELGNLGARANALNSELSNATFYYQQQLDQLVQTGNSVRKSLQAHDQVNSLVTAVRNFENKFAEALLHEHTAHVAAANAGVHMPVGALSPGGRTTTILTSSSYAGTKTAVAGAADATDEKIQQAQQAERALLLNNTLKSYVAAEAQCIHFLTDRMLPAEAKLVTLRKELLAYAALSMKGAVVQQAEASVKQLENEVLEDQQAVHQLQQNVADTLAQVKALQDSLAPVVSARAGKYVAPGSKVAPAAALPTAAAVKFDMPSAELALIVQHCNSVQITPAVVILAHAGKIAARVPPAPAPVVATAPAAAHPVISAAPVANPAPAAKPSSDRTAPAADASAARKPKATTSGRTERDKGADVRRNGAGRGKAEAKAEVDTSSAIQLLEKSCLQKPTGSGAPAMKSALVRVERAVPKAEPSAPVSSVWKVPASGAHGVLESKAGESVKSLKEIQEEQQNEKSRLAQQKAQKKKDEIAAAAVFLAAPKPVAGGDAKATAVEETPAAPVVASPEIPAVASADRVVVGDSGAAGEVQVTVTAVETTKDTATETASPTPGKAAKTSKTPKKELKDEVAKTGNDVAETPTAAEPAEVPAVLPAESETTESLPKTKSAVKKTSSKTKPFTLPTEGDENTVAVIGNAGELSAEETTATESPAKAVKVKSTVKKTPSKATPVVAPGEESVAVTDEAVVVEDLPIDSPVKAPKVKSAIKKTPSKATSVVAEEDAVVATHAAVESEEGQINESPAKVPKVKPAVKKSATKAAPSDSTVEATESTAEHVGDSAAVDAVLSSDAPAKVAKVKSAVKRTPSKAIPVIAAEVGDGSAVDSTESAPADEAMPSDSPVKIKSATKKTPSKAAPVVATGEDGAVTATDEEAVLSDSPVKAPKVKSAIKKTPSKVTPVATAEACEDSSAVDSFEAAPADKSTASESPVKAPKVKSAVKKTPSKAAPVIAGEDPVATTEETSDTRETPAKASKVAKVKSAAKKTPSKATPVIATHDTSDDNDGALPIESTDSTEGEAVLSVEIDTSHVRASTPTGSSTHAEAGSRSPLVEFHSTYTFEEEGVHHAVSRSHDINPMQQLSPLVEHHSIYPEVSDESDLLNEIEENDAIDGEGQGTPLGAALSVSTVNTANTASSKIRDINPMALASPGRGIVRIKLDMSQASEGDESALSPSMMLD